jgi:hypothetical protein
MTNVFRYISTPPFSIAPGTYTMKLSVKTAAGRISVCPVGLNNIPVGVTNHVVYEQDLITFDATNTVRARCSDAGQLASLFALTRIPAEAAFIVPATFTAGLGIRCAGGSAYPFNGTSVTGAAIAATHGDSEFAVPPGDSMLVVHAGRGADATGTLRVTERHLGLS